VLRLSHFFVDLDLVFGSIERPDRGVTDGPGRGQGRYEGGPRSIQHQVDL